MPGPAAAATVWDPSSGPGWARVRCRSPGPEAKLLSGLGQPQPLSQSATLRPTAADTPGLRRLEARLQQGVLAVLAIAWRATGALAPRGANALRSRQLRRRC